MFRSFELPLDPTPKHRAALHDLRLFQCEVYNAALAERRGAWNWNRRGVSKREQYRQITGWDDPRVKQFGVAVTRGSLLRLDRAFAAFFRRVKNGETPGFPRFRPPSRFDSVEWDDSQSWKIVGPRLRVQGVGHIRIKSSKRQLKRLVGAIPKTLCVRVKGGKWTAFVACEVAKPEEREKTGKQVGLDVGIASFVTTSDGEQVANPRWYRSTEERLCAAYRDRDRFRKGSNRWRKANYRIARLYGKQSNQRKDFHHKLSKQLVAEFDVIAVEDLQIANMVRRPKPVKNEDGSYAPNGAAAKAGLNKSIADAGWGQFTRMIEYKAESAGTQFVRVNPRNSSRECNQCGHTVKGNRTCQSEFLCLACGHSAHADVNAACNILGRGQRLLESSDKSEAPSEVAA